MTVRTYSELISLKTYEERFDYLKLWDSPHVPPDDVLYRQFLKTKSWLLVREQVIDRDLCQDLGVIGRFCDNIIIVHHMNPITTEDLKNNDLDRLLNPEYLITTVIDTHNKIHYKPIDTPPVLLERQPGDTKLW